MYAQIMLVKYFLIIKYLIYIYCIAQKFNGDEFNERSEIRQNFSFQPLLCNTFLLKTTVDLSKFCLSNFMHR